MNLLGNLLWQSLRRLELQGSNRLRLGTPFSRLAKDALQYTNSDSGAFRQSAPGGEPGVMVISALPESLGLAFGVVLGTKGVERHAITFHGQEAHSGSARSE